MRSLTEIKESLRALRYGKAWREIAQKMPCDYTTISRIYRGQVPRGNTMERLDQVLDEFVKKGS